MADQPIAKTNGGAGVPVPATTPAPAALSWADEPWEARPPRAPIDPPPCSPDVPTGTTTATVPLAPRLDEPAPTGALDTVKLALEAIALTDPHIPIPHATDTARAAQPRLAKEMPAAEVQKIIDRLKRGPQGEKTA